MYFSYGSAETEYLKRRDRTLGAVIDRVGHIYREADTELFSSVVHHIAGQQISSKALETVWGRMLGGLGEITPARIAAAGEAGLCSFGISQRKAGYITDLAEKVQSGEFNLAAVAAMPDAEAIAALSSLRGIGVWTAEMLLLFCLQRPDIFSFDDLALRRGLRMVYRHREITRALFEKYRRRYSPFGSVASLYLWAVSGGALPELTDPAARGKQNPRGRAAKKTSAPS